MIRFCRHKWETKGVGYSSTFDTSGDALPFKNTTNVALCCKNCGKYKQKVLKGHIEMLVKGIRVVPHK